MNNLFEITGKISSSWSLAAFAIIALVLLGIRLKSRKVPLVAWAIVVAIVILSLAPILAPLYLGSYGVYRVRVVVLGERQVPTNEAKVTCSIGGEIKKVEGGWECDIPAKNKPGDGKFQVYATTENAFLTGRIELELKDDYNPVGSITLTKEDSARIIGMVVDDHEAPIEGVRIGVIGYESELSTTQKGGNFSLPAHAAKGQQVQLTVGKDGYSSTTEWHQAGDFPATVRLHRQRPLKQKP